MIRSRRVWRSPTAGGAIERFSVTMRGIAPATLRLLTRSTILRTKPLDAPTNAVLSWYVR